MKRFGKEMIIIILSVLFLIVFLHREKLIALISHKVVSVDIVSEDYLREVKAGKKASDMYPKLTYNNAWVAYDKGTDTIYIPQNMSNKNFEGSLKTTESELEIFFKGDEYFKNKEKAIKEGHVFDLYLVNDTHYHTCRVVFTGMPVMSIATENNDEIEVDEAGREIYTGSVQVYDPYHSSTQFQTAECTYHKRGGSSQNYEKPNYKLELSDKKLSFLGLREDDDWILNSLYDDAGLIHNKVSFQVWRKIAAYNDVINDEGVLAEYLELFVDDEYRGVYLLTERVDQKTLSLGKKDLLYKCRADRIPEEHNYTNENTDEMRPIFILKYPKEPVDKDWEPLKDWVNAFCKLQMNSYEEGADLLNMENAIDYNLFTLLACGVDNMRKNVCLIAEYGNDATYRFKKVPWDMNATWGNPWVYDSDCNYTIYDPEYIKDVNTWCTDISTLYYYNETEVSSLLKERWQKFRNDGLITKEGLYGIVDGQLKYLHDSGAYERNYERWPHGSEYWKDGYIYEYIDGRIDFLDGYFEKLYKETVTPAIYNGVDYSDEFEVRFYWERYKLTLAELYPYDRQQLLEHYVMYGKPFELHGRRSTDFADDWEYLYGSKVNGSEGSW